MKSVNKVILIGSLGKDPELKQVGSSSVAKFTLATNEKYKNKAGEQQERTEWHNIEVWGKLAEIAAEYLKKGRQVYLEGTINTQTWDDKDGNKRYMTIIKVWDMVLLGGANNGGTRDEFDQRRPEEERAAERSKQASNKEKKDEFFDDYNN